VANLSTIDFFDPRGRINRKGLAIFAAVLIGAQAGLYGALIANEGSFHTGLANVINAVLFWMGFVAAAKRLHDFNMSSWWLLGALGAMAIWCFALSFTLVYMLGEEGFGPGGAGMITAVLGTSLPLLAALIWIHCAKGETGPNRFGSAPGPSGFSSRHPERHVSAELKLA
jgi:uncharacterized membrane protein YhaH (DUF805 family)